MSKKNILPNQAQVFLSEKYVYFPISQIQGFCHSKFDQPASSSSIFHGNVEAYCLEKNKLVLRLIFFIKKKNQQNI